MLASLNRFIFKSFKHRQLLFQLLKKEKGLIWNDDYSKALQKIKFYLSKPPILVITKGKDLLYLYLVVSDHTVSSILIWEKEGGQQPIYYTDKTLMDAEQ